MKNATRNVKRALAVAWRISLFLFIYLHVTPVFSQEIYLAGGFINRNEDGERSYSWLISYFEGLSEHFAWSFSWLNEGHLPDHHRDGPSVQFWARKAFFDRRFSVAAGVGPYLSFDTSREGMVDGDYQNTRQLGGLLSLNATWYMTNRWLLQTRLENVWLNSNVDTTALMLGIGYQIGPVEPLESDTTPTSEKDDYGGTNNEITLFVGTAVLNGHFENDIAAAVEYRRNIVRYLSWTIGWIHEIDTPDADRQGLTSQLWGVKTFFEERLSLGVGLGVYAFKDDAPQPESGVDEDLRTAWLGTLTASYRLPWQLVVRTSWSRTITNYDRDSDIFLAGLGYRF